MKTKSIYAEDAETYMEINQNLKHTCKDVLNKKFVTSYRHQNQKKKINDWYMKMDSPICITANSECMNVPLESANENDSTEMLFVNKPVSIP